MYEVWFDVNFVDSQYVESFGFLIAAENMRSCRKIALYRLKHSLANVRRSWKVVNCTAEEVFLPDKEAV